MRVFIASDISDDAKEKLGSVIEDLNRTGMPAKWVSKKDLHITFKFIGEVKEDKVEGLIESVERSCRGEKAFNILLNGIGAFPDQKEPRVIWAGIKEGAGNVANLAKKIEDVLSADNICKKEERGFKDHVTIGRIKDNARVSDFSTALRGLKDVSLGSSRLDSVNIMKSTLRPEGPVYKVIKKIALAG